MTILRRWFAVTALALGFALPASATTYSIDYTDLWYNSPAESESGWGVNIIQQNHILFVTVYVYGPDGTPRWYSGSNVSATSQTTFSGKLYATTGTYFGTPWVPPPGITEVGSIAFNFTSATTGSMSYNVNNVVVTKNITRVTWTANVLTGNYVGGATAYGAQCGGNGGVLISGALTVTHQQPAVSMVVDFVSFGLAARCTYNGTYSQVGNVGAINGGTFSCVRSGVNVGAGTFSVSEIATSRNGFNGRFTATDQNCSYSGYFGGIKDVF